MTENGNPLENAVAERINGIIKDEYLETYDINNINEARTLLKDIVNLYNNERPHMSISNLTPNHVSSFKNQDKNRKIMEELLSKKSYYCKPKSGLKMNCKLITELIY
ncbi:MAG: integrase core domain-containing protein [Chitinophagales bacterium]|nr:integrase core domain-containing protein [Chitinophagales bacterium]